MGCEADTAGSLLNPSWKMWRARQQVSHQQERWGKGHQIRISQQPQRWSGQGKHELYPWIKCGPRPENNGMSPLRSCPTGFPWEWDFSTRGWRWHTGFLVDRWQRVKAATGERTSGHVSQVHVNQSQLQTLLNPERREDLFHWKYLKGEWDTNYISFTMMSFFQLSLSSIQAKLATSALWKYDPHLPMPTVCCQYVYSFADDCSFPSGCIWDFLYILNILQYVMSLGVDLFFFNYLEELRLIFWSQISNNFVWLFQCWKLSLKYCVFTISSILELSSNIYMEDSQTVSMSLYYFTFLVLALSVAKGPIP